jgi:hypothetical protein
VPSWSIALLAFPSRYVATVSDTVLAPDNSCGAWAIPSRPVPSHILGRHPRHVLTGGACEIASVPIMEPNEEEWVRRRVVPAGRQVLDHAIDDLLRPRGHGG